MPGHGVGGEQFETGFEEELFLEWVAHLHRGTVLARFLSQFPRGERRTRQPVATGLRADVKDRVAHPAGRAARELLMPQYAEAKNVHQWIAVEAFVEINLAADRRDADAVSVMRDAGDDTGKEPSVGRYRVFPVAV